ncbi:MAG: hypothetical protein ABW321_12755, partial [Polyangiales bacterium]
PHSVPGALLLPGRGLHGGGSEPDFTRLSTPLRTSGESDALRETALVDPAVHFADQETRPAWYARSLAESARNLALLEDGAQRPDWWLALGGLAHVHMRTFGSPLAAFTHLISHLEVEQPTVDMRDSVRALAGIGR